MNNLTRAIEMASVPIVSIVCSPFDNWGRLKNLIYLSDPFRTAAEPLERHHLIGGITWTLVLDLKFLSPDEVVLNVQQKLE